MKRATSALLHAAQGKRFTAAVLRVERGGRPVFEEAYGTLEDSPDAAQVEVTTRFDLASLTKLYVATAVLQQVAEGRLTLDAPLLEIVPEWNAERRGITLRRLLAHTSGMQSGADYRTLFDTDVEQFALHRPLLAEPGRRVIYSDLGFIALGVVLARATGRSLASVVATASARSNARATAFRPSPSERKAIPATEYDAWRGRVRGSVHDEKAELMGGAAGHAGLFGTARDVAALSEIFLGPLHARPHAALPAALAASAISEHGRDPILRRGLGWALKTSDENSCGAAMSRATFGHTGFTGTSVWVDPERDLSVVLLTNAVYYGRGDLRDLRAAVGDAAVAEFG
ncbi:MAG TPA: serine hydrolase domain-containing protein [Candidatus Baltobacteraceae bacterium]|nr:serine hydrolase domain-containing protein [Candidatus Baltobacteraceae bacterium]